MSVKRLLAVFAIFIATTIAWMILSGATAYRSQNTYNRLNKGYEGETGGRAAVQQLWGQPQSQIAPAVWASHKERQKRLNAKGKVYFEEVGVTDAVDLAKSRVKVRINLEPRRKGLLWYSTYKVKFSGDYAFKNTFSNERKFSVRFVFPQGQAAYDNVLVRMNGKEIYPGGDLTEGLVVPVALSPGQDADFSVTYASQGMDTWRYQFKGESGVASVRDFDAEIATNTKEIDFPQNSMSPNYENLTRDGWRLQWKYGHLISNSDIGVAMPQKLNPGPFATRLSLFAPVCLLFFFAVLLILQVVKGVRLHPMHYVMLAATFFSFHLLFSYMVDHVTPFYAFLVSSVVSMLLTISYLRLAVNWRFAVFQAGLWQFVFLVLFTYAFFFEGYTGLTITIGAIVTLAVLMQMTGRINWDERLAANPPPPGASNPR